MILILEEKRCTFYWQLKTQVHHEICDYTQALSVIRQNSFKPRKDINVIFALRENIFDYRPLSNLSWWKRLRLHQLMRHELEREIEGYIKQKQAALYFCHTLPQPLLILLQALHKRKRCAYSVLPLLLAKEIAQQQKPTAAWTCYHVKMMSTQQWDIVFSKQTLFCCRYTVALDPNLSTVTYLNHSKNATSVQEIEIDYQQETSSPKKTFYLLKKLLKHGKTQKLFLPSTLRPAFWQTRSFSIALMMTLLGTTLAYTQFLAWQNNHVSKNHLPTFHTSQEKDILLPLKEKAYAQRHLFETVPIKFISMLKGDFAPSTNLSLTFQSTAAKKRFERRSQRFTGKAYVLMPVNAHQLKITAREEKP